MPGGPRGGQREKRAARRTPIRFSFRLYLDDFIGEKLDKRKANVFPGNMPCPHDPEAGGFSSYILLLFTLIWKTPNDLNEIKAKRKA
jgi:hypothetical protein